MPRSLTIGSLFSGIGGLDLAAHWAGFTTSWFVEREPFCQKVLAKHWPNVPIHSDVFEAHDLPHVDVIVGGFPCQPFSVAGNRKGADDERYLLPEMLRIIREVKPYAVLFENVPGFPSLNDGAEFKYLLRALAEMGFDAEWGHLRASDSGAPHQRERWFCVAHTSGSGSTQPIWGQDSIQRQIVFIPERQGDVTRKHFATGSDDLTKNMADTNSERFIQSSPLGCTGQVISGYISMVNTSSAGRQERNITTIASKTGHTTGRHHANVGNAQRSRSAGHTRRGAGAQLTNGHTRNGRAAQSRLRGTPDGLSCGLDFPGWPARPGEDQHAYEPSRVTSAKTPDRAARLKALGNAVVPQVAYPLFVAIHEWLTGTETSTQRTDGVA